MNAIFTRRRPEAAAKAYPQMTIREKKAFWAENPLNGDIPIRLPFRPATFLMHCENDDTVVKELYWTDFSGWEPHSLRLWHLLSQQVGERCVLDIGAYSGIYSLIAAQNAPGARVMAFDIQTRCLQRVRTNVDLNGFANVETHLAACGATDGTCTFHFYEEPGILSSVASTIPKAMNDRSAEVQALRLDTLLGGRGLLDRVGLVKIDVEDAETATLSGMQEVLERARPDLLVEVNNPANLARVGALLPQGYTIWSINEDSGSLDPLEEGAGGGAHRNYLLTARSASDVHALHAAASA